jgi:hypothetical protein
LVTATNIASVTETPPLLLPVLSLFSVAAQAMELQQLLPGAGPAPLDQLLQPGFQAISNPGVSWAVGDRGKQLLYPDWMAGTWQVSSSSSHAMLCVCFGVCGA